MKVIVACIALLVLLAVSVEATACGTYILRCATLGQNCTAGATDGQAIGVNPAVCPDGAGDVSSPPSCVTCQAGLYCHPDAYCAPISGRPCTSTPQCQSFIPDYTLTPQVCSGGFCIDSPSDIYSHGDTCATTTQCKGVMTCNANSTCVNPGTSCTTTAECPYDNYCFGGSCLARKAAGGSCIDNPTEECQYGLSCSEGTCSNSFSGNVGADCGDALSQRIGCLDGFQCQQEPVNMTFVCGVHPNIIGSECVANLAGECSTVKGGKCLCSLASGVGECFPDVPRSICSSEWQVFLDCMGANECHLDPTLGQFYDGTCARTSCTNSYATLLSCLDQPRDFVSNNCGTVDSARVAAGLAPRGESDVVASGAGTLGTGFWGMFF